MGLLEMWVKTLRSLWIWTVPVLLILIWLPILGIIRLFDRDPVRYRTGLWFRRLGATMVRTNPSWHLSTLGSLDINPHLPYVVVCNHQSFADIPLISTLPWEMKWLAKTELFRFPIIGWMLKMAGDIPVDRGDRRKGAQSLLRAKWYLENSCSVIFFPEGTRSPDGRVQKFNEGAFHIAVRNSIPILPLAIDGSFGALPKNTWIYGDSSEIKLAVLDPIESTGKNVTALCDEVREKIIRQIAVWRGVGHEEVAAQNTASPPVNTES
ncbi:MAG: lysophospholipid acyltransferase family protein [Bacteroidota bacterium]